MIYRSVGKLIGEQKVVSLDAGATVREAAQRMAIHRVGAIPVTESGKLVGLFTQRDLLNRVVARGLPPEETRLADVMTRDPITVESNHTVVSSLSTMVENRFRHLPVLDKGEVVGVLSSRDIPTGYWVMTEQLLAAQSSRRAAAG